MAQLLLAVNFIHINNIVHKSISLESIWLLNKDPMDVCFKDLSKAQYLGSRDALSNGNYGVPGYIAPEIILGHNYRKEADIFSLGVVLFNLLS